MKPFLTALVTAWTAQCGGPGEPASETSSALENSAPGESRAAGNEGAPEPAPVPPLSEGAGAAPTSPAPIATTPEAQSAAAVDPGSVRLVVITEEALGSERRAYERTKRAFTEAGLAADLVWTVPSDGEAVAAEGWLAGEAPASLRAEWRSYEHLVFVRLAPPRTQRSGRRVSAGVSGLLVARPPSTTPVFAVQGHGEAGWANAGETYSTRPFSAWLLDLMRAERAGEPP